MKRVAEIMYIIPSEREAFLKASLNPSMETQRVLWMCGVRRQQYFAMNDLIFMTFEYEGVDFAKDMQKMANYLSTINQLIKKRRKDVPTEEQYSTSWWAPVKKLGSLLECNPMAVLNEQDEEDTDEEYLSIHDGGMQDEGFVNDISYDDDDWTGAIHF